MVTGVDHHPVAHVDTDVARADDQGLRIVSVEVDLDDLVLEEARRLRTSTTLEVPLSVTPVRILGDPYSSGRCCGTSPTTRPATRPRRLR